MHACQRYFFSGQRAAKIQLAATYKPIATNTVSRPPIGSEPLLHVTTVPSLAQQFPQHRHLWRHVSALLNDAPTYGGASFNRCQAGAYPEGMLLPGTKLPSDFGSEGEPSSDDELLLDNMSVLAEAVEPAEPEPPTICCMSGCANCVWIEYAERLAAHYRDGGEAGRRAIEANVTDPSLKAFLLLELRTR